MTEIALGVAVVVAALLLASGWAYHSRQADRVLQSKIRRNVLVTFKTGEAFGGVLVESDATYLVLRQATEAQSSTAVDGELLIRWADVSFVQIP